MRLEPFATSRTVMSASVQEWHQPEIMCLETCEQETAVSFALRRLTLEIYSIKSIPGSNQPPWILPTSLYRVDRVESK